jgi:hypothetical protein
MFVNDGETPLKSWLVCWLDHSVERRILVEEFGTMTTRIFETKSGETMGEPGEKCVLRNLLNLSL